MGQIENICLSILKSAIWGTDLEIHKCFNYWDEVIIFAQKQSIIGIVSYTLLNSSTILIPEHIREKLKQIILNNIVTFHKVDSAMIKVYVELQNKGLKPILLKGQGIARYYSNPELRQCGDVDIYIGKEGYIKAYNILKDIATKIDSEDKLIYGKHFHMYLSKIQFDIHSYSGIYSLPFYNKRYQEESDKGIFFNNVKVTIDNHSISTPSIEFNAYYLFNHMYNHFLTSGIGWRHICDLMMYLHKMYMTINHVELNRILKRMDVLYPWQLFGNLLVNKFGLPKEEFPLFKVLSINKVNKLYNHILSEGNFGYGTMYYKRTNSSYILRKFKSFIWYTQRSYDLMILFPKQIIMHWVNMMALGISIIVKDIRLFCKVKSNINNEF